MKEMDTYFLIEKSGELQSLSQDDEAMDESDDDESKVYNPILDTPPAKNFSAAKIKELSHLSKWDM